MPRVTVMAEDVPSWNPARMSLTKNQCGDTHTSIWLPEYSDSSDRLDSEEAWSLPCWGFLTLSDSPDLSYLCGKFSVLNRSHAERANSLH